MASPLSTFAGWQLAVHCPTCRDTRTVQIDAVIARRGRAVPVRDVVPWLRCRACRTLADRVDIVSTAEPAQRLLLHERVAPPEEPGE